jgi:hypothetical protein
VGLSLVRLCRLKPRRSRSVYFLDNHAVVVTSWVTDVSGQDNGPIIMGQSKKNGCLGLDNVDRQVVLERPSQISNQSYIKPSR